MQNGSRQTKRRPDFFLEKYVELEQLFPDLQFGFAILDKKLRYQHVSGQLAELSGIDGDNLQGKEIGEVTPHIANALEPMLFRVMTEDRPCFEPAVTIPTPGNLKTACTWQVRSYPLHGQDGKVLGAGIVVRDVTEQKLREATQAERLQFESLLATLSTTFINVPVSEVDDKIVQGLQKIVDFLGFDRSTVWRVDPDTGEMICTHSYELPGIKPPLAVLPHAMVPVWNSMVKSGEIFKISDIDELPDRFWREKQYCRDRGGIRSIVFIPSQVGGVVEGFITFVSYSVIRTWPDDLIQRLRMLWDIFANSLERKRADQKIQHALAEIRTLKDRLEAENVYLRDQIHIEYKPDEIIGRSAPIRTVLRQLQQVAHTDATVLLLGETGTGKELLARAIHNLSNRRERTMIKVNCAALPAALIETELFGHEKGAYTGAAARRMGRFEAANGSTIFLDEIGELPLDLQAKLLRVLQEGQFERLGSTRPIEVDARVVAATNRDLAREVKEGRFREDLYYRLNVFPIAVPPLRERKEDIPLLVAAMVREFAGAFGKTIERVPKKTMDDLMHYSWPGNIRELRNVIERAMILSNGATLHVDLPDGTPTIAPRSNLLHEVERLHIADILERTGWRIRGRNGAAELLGLKPTTLESRMLKLGISRAATPSEIP
ncbi:sigma 54-interacting transcriptional regulator [Geotalea sp. SG265]|uniref:sigma 54-interacting transcriptional regulator n=1 Tax=Geotalea sp. SG265 TaxID=2922867 RepID=UPI001FAFCC33|nr:sigma 54-interacting transcriptional regulator [Geotalea sp. SG265]